MNKNARFNFYSIFKNEDANPYLDDGLMVVADGLGGAGSAVHFLDYRKYENLQEEILQEAFFDFEWDKVEGLKEYADILVQPMSDFIPDTSALWASRIAIARFVYAVKTLFGADLDNNDIRADIVRFVLKGLTNTAHYFKLYESKRGDNQLLLPTTLAAIKYEDNNDKVTAEAMWAGDSRCYALTKKGLRLLSVDDEDASGAITNLFYASDVLPQLHYRKYVIEKPCVLMTVSDGIFDPFEPHDNLGVEETLLDAMAKSCDMQQFKDALTEVYDGIRQDDATLNFASFGFDSYTDMVEFFKPRYEELYSFIDEYASMRDIIAVSDLEEEDLKSYIVLRTKDKFEKIASLLYDCYNSGGRDIALKDKFNDYINQIAERFAKMSEKAKHDEYIEVLGRLANYFTERREDFCKEYAAKRKTVSVKVPKEYRLLNICSKKINKLKAQLSDILCKNIEERKYKDRMLEQICVGKARLQTEVAILSLCENFVKNEQNFGDREGLQSLIQEFDEVIADDNFGVNELENIKNNVCAYYEKKRTLNKGLNRVNLNLCKKKEEYDSLLTDFFKYLYKENHIEEFFTEKTLKANGYARLEAKTASPEAVKKEVLENMLNQKDFLSEKIVENIIEHCDETSVIDECYNEGKLKTFRTYYNTDRRQVLSAREFVNKIDELEKEYYSMLEDTV